MNWREFFIKAGLCKSPRSADVLLQRRSVAVGTFRNGKKSIWREITSDGPVEKGWVFYHREDKRLVKVKFYGHPPYRLVVKGPRADFKTKRKWWESWTKINLLKRLAN